MIGRSVSFCARNEIKIYRNKLAIYTGRKAYTRMLVLDSDTPSSGEMKIKAEYFQKQIAGTLAAFLGLDYSNKQCVGEVIHSMIRSEMLSDNISSGKNVSNIYK